MDVSVIIPTVNEERALPATLEALGAQSRACEVIVVDSGSTDATREIVERYSERMEHCQFVEASRGRGVQMNAGAKLASGEWLLFLHADTILPPEAIEAIAALTARTEIAAGCFRHRFSGSGIVLRAISLAHNYRFRRTLIMYGDQAMFVRAALFRELGAFPEALMEDVLLSERLRRKTRPIMLPQTIVTDSRKFEQIGKLRALWWVVRILLAHRDGRPLTHRRFFGEFR